MSNDHSTDHADRDLYNANLSAGNHNFVAVTTDSASPPNSSPVSNAQAVTVPLSGPAAITDFRGTLNP